jgi:hypothetical protein
MQHDLDRTLDAAKLWSRLEDEEPVAEALVRNEERMRRTRDELRVDYREVHRVRGAMVAALVG